MRITNWSRKRLPGVCFALAAVALFTTSCATTHETHWGSRPDPTSTKGGAVELTRPR